MGREPPDFSMLTLVRRVEFSSIEPSSLNSNTTQRSTRTYQTLIPLRGVGYMNSNSPDMETIMNLALELSTEDMDIDRDDR